MTAFLHCSEFIVWPFECVGTLLSCLPMGVDLEGSAGREMTKGLVSSLLALVYLPLGSEHAISVHVKVCCGCTRVLDLDCYVLGKLKTSAS